MHQVTFIPTNVAWQRYDNDTIIYVVFDHQHRRYRTLDSTLADRAESAWNLNRAVTVWYYEHHGSCLIVRLRIGPRRPARGASLAERQRVFERMKKQNARLNRKEAKRGME